MINRVFLSTLFVLLLSSYNYAQEQVDVLKKERYLEFARHSADWTWEHYDSLEIAWERNLDPDNIFGYRPPPHFLEMAAIYASLYQAEGKKVYAERALKVLMNYDSYRKSYPEYAALKRADYSDGVPALPDFFTAMRYIRTYVILMEGGYLNGSQKKYIENIIAQSVEYTLQSQEWGPMNRSALRAETLAWAVRAMPDDPRSEKWEMYKKALESDNWGNWEIEDATIYHAVWLYSLLGYADCENRMEELFRTPEMYYYARYFLYLMCPDGMIPDFGDASWQSNWSRYLVFFEASAAIYKDQEMKWAAGIMADHFIDWSSVSNTGLGYLLLDAWRFGSDNVPVKQPEKLSMEVMEDMVGKKIVYRDGWTPESTYMLLNYRDEGDGGLIYRDYLRDVIPVEEEKMTHGHADENSIVLLMKNGSVLLHDGGYRDYMPSGPYGAYRQDYFHNRLCVRQEKIWFGQKEGEYRYSAEGRPEIPGQPVMDFLRNAGSYRQVETKKIDFLTFPEFDYSRTRLIDDNLGYQWDRVIAWIKDPGLFVIFDVFKSEKEAYFTAANLWHTREIVESGEHWYDTRYDSLGSLALNSDTRLLIHFPMNHYRFEQVEKIKRYYQDEYVISEYTAQHFELGQHIGFVTILVPHLKDENPGSWVDRINFVRTDEGDNGLGIEIQYNGRFILAGIKCDLKMDIVRDYRRPKYTWESGKIAYGPVETNSDFFYTEKSGQELKYTAVNVTRFDYRGQTLFSQKPNYFYLAFDGSMDVEGVGKVRYWRDTLRLEK